MQSVIWRQQSQYDPQCLRFPHIYGVMAEMLKSFGQDFDFLCKIANLPTFILMA